MATQESLESRAADATSVDDLTAIASEALAEPADPAFAKSLLEKAEMQCQFPLDYIKVAEIAVGLADPAYADDLYEQAEDACFEAKEFAALGHSLAVYKHDQDKARELLTKAADEASQTAEFLMCATYARADLQDEDLAASMMEKVEGKCKSLADYQGLARTVLDDTQDRDAALALYRKGAKYCDEVSDTVAFAQGLKDMFDDDAAVRAALEEAETDCQFTHQFVSLAGGFKNLLDDGDKVTELMEQAAEFSMSGEEFMQLAEGYWSLLQDKEGAVQAYEKALADISAQGELLQLASKIATEIGDRDLAKKVYAKAESKTTGAGDLAKLAQAVCDDLDDREFASEIYSRAEESMSAPNELITLAGEIFKNLEDGDRARKLYRAALAKIGDFAPLMKLATTVHDTLSDASVTGEVLAKAQASAAASPQHLEVAGRYFEYVADPVSGALALEQAEEAVTTLDEMKKVLATREARLPEDTEGLDRVREKLAKREANQERYTAFQKRESAVHTAKQIIGLADAVMAELEDVFYARKLLVTAETMLAEQAFDFSQTRLLILAIDRHLQDRDWLVKLFDGAAQACTHFAWLSEVCHSALNEISDNSLGRELATRYYHAWRDRLGDSAGIYDYLKLALAVGRDLGDSAARDEILALAEAAASSHLALANVGKIFADTGDAARASQLYDRAAEVCTKGEQFVQLASSMRGFGVPADEIHRVYAKGARVLSAGPEKLRWAEGMADTLNDPQWADETLSELSADAADAALARRIQASRKSRTGPRFYG